MTRRTTKAGDHVDLLAPTGFRNSTIKADRELRRDPAYGSEFPHTPIRTSELAVALSAEEFAAFNSVKRSDIYGEDDSAALRDDPNLAKGYNRTALASGLC